MKEPDPAAEFAFKTLGKKVFSVSEITRRVRELIENNFPSVWIEGEISNFKQIMSGHVYFTLKDE
ncbi:MAG TPA: exodeoxyribonuclease VII large subunit, partial [bacterium]